MNKQQRPTIRHSRPPEVGGNLSVHSTRRAIVDSRLRGNDGKAERAMKFLRKIELMSLVVVVCCVLLCAAGPLQAQTTQPSASKPATPSVEPSLDQLLDLPPPGSDAGSTPGNSSAATQPASSRQAQPGMALPLPITPPTSPKTSDGSAEDNFRTALDQMRQASDRMSQKLDVGLRTQRIQASALALMDQVIEEAAKQQQQQQQQQNQQQQQKQGGSPKNAKQSQQQASSQGQQKKPSNQASKGGTSRGSASQAQPADPLHQTQSQWGNLPPRLRAQLLQGMNERFSPIYQRLTEAYYRRLAEESSSPAESSP